MNNSLENAKVGDKLLMTGRRNTSLITVEKVTKAFVIANGYKFRKLSGSLVTSDGWSFASARLATEADIQRLKQAAKRQKMLSQCRDIRFEGLSDTRLEQILEIANTPELLNEKER